MGLGSYDLSRNVAWGNGGYGIRWKTQTVDVTFCNDWFGNLAGNVLGRAESDSDFSIDPQFCRPGAGDFHVRETSPLLGRAGCDSLVGALGMGCDTVNTAAVVVRFEAERVGEAIRIVWEVSSTVTNSEVWLERADDLVGPWTRPKMERSYEGRAVIELDRSVRLDHAYWYRLVSQAGIVGQPVRVGRATTPAFGLLQVSPNPGSGSVQVRFALGHSAEIDIDILDVQGRRVASLVHGLLADGEHAVEWSGLTRNGSVFSGLYLLRYRYPRGQECQRLVHFR